MFAYGATGAGKTFTMLGSLEHPGIVFHAMVDLYQRVEQLRDDKTCDIAVCYIEVFNKLYCSASLCFETSKISNSNLKQLKFKIMCLLHCLF